MFLSTLGNTSLSAPPPEAAMMYFLLCMSAQVRMPVEAMKAQTLTSFDTLPSQVNFVASNCAASAEGRPSSGSNITPGAKWAIAVPSLGATL